MAEVIELFAALRKHETFSAGGRRTAKDRMTIEIVAPELRFSADDGAIAGIFAATLTDLARKHMAEGRMPFTGQPLPAASSATLERREYREAQGNRGGQLTPRIKDQQKRATGLRNYNRRFTATQLGSFVPGKNVIKGLFGIESGMLAKSIKTIATGEGTWKVFFAGPRGNLDDSGTSAVGRTRKIFEFTQTAMVQPEIQSALRRVASGLIAKRGQKLLSEAFKTLTLLRDMADNGR